MTNGEKQKAIDALKISAPVIAVTQEEFNDYIQTLNKIMDWLEQEPTIKNDKIDCERTDCNNCVNHKYCDYESTTKNDLAVDCISRKAVLDKAIAQNWVENFAKFTSFSSTIEKPMDFWELYKKQLSLWSNINTNCYVKLKENI